MANEFQLEQLKKFNKVELMILTHLSNGKRARDIAALNRCTVGVIEQKIHKMKNNAGAATAASLVAMALRNQIIS